MQRALTCPGAGRRPRAGTCELRLRRRPRGLQARRPGCRGKRLERRKSRPTQGTPTHCSGSPESASTNNGGRCRTTRERGERREPIRRRRCHQDFYRVKRAIGALDPATVTVPKDGTRVPFAITDPLPILKVRVNDKADAYFLLDTGAPTASLDPAFASELGLKTEEDGTGGCSSAARRRRSNAPRSSSLTLGSATIRKLTRRTLSHAGILKLDARYRLDGVIGTGVLYRFLSTIDYPRGELVCKLRRATHRPTSSVEPRKATPSPCRCGWSAITFIFIQANVNDGPKRLFNVDTGAAGVGIMPSPATVADSHITLDAAHASEATGGGGKVKIVPFVATVRFATIRRTDVLGLLYARRQPVWALPLRGGRLAVAPGLPPVRPHVRLCRDETARRGTVRREDRGNPEGERASYRPASARASQRGARRPIWGISP